MDPLNNNFYITPLKVISHPKGDLYHALKKSDTGFKEFGEAYFSSILLGEFKGWKCHSLMQMNLVVPIGRVAFYIHDEKVKKTSKVFLGDDNYMRLTIPPNLWVAFEGLTSNVNLILNIASIEHDPSEVRSVPIETFSLIC